MCWSMLWDHTVYIPLSFWKRPTILRWLPRHTESTVTGLSSDLCSFQGEEISGIPLSRPSYNNLCYGNVKLSRPINLAPCRGTFRNDFYSQFYYKIAVNKTNSCLAVRDFSMFRLALFPWPLSELLKPYQKPTSASTWVSTVGTGEHDECVLVTPSRASILLHERLTANTTQHLKGKENCKEWW